MGEQNKAAPRAGNAGTADNGRRPQYTTFAPPVQLSPIVCERCGAFEYITLAEQAHRLDETGSILCGECYTRPIRVADGGPVHWGVCDALFGFLRELEQAEIVAFRDAGVWNCLRAAYRAMGGADYLTPGDRAVIAGVWDER